MLSFFAVKYVALLAFNKIVKSYPQLVSLHEDVILDCIDDPDISIRLQALDLGSGMINSDNLVSVVDRLMQQLRTAPSRVSWDSLDHEASLPNGIEPAADSDGEDPEETLRHSKTKEGEVSALPDEYRISIIRRILSVCSRNTYENITDFEWYIDTLAALVRLAPSSISQADNSLVCDNNNGSIAPDFNDVSCGIGIELQNVAVRVVAVRVEAVSAANSLVTAYQRGKLLTTANTGGQCVLQYAAWVVGEYARNVPNQYDTLSSFLHIPTQSLGSQIICSYLQSIPKLLVALVECDESRWTIERRTMMSLLLARVISFLEPLALHPSLEVQERSVELLELMRVAAEALENHRLDSEGGPLLLTKVMPLLFTGLELNPVAPTAQQKVPLPNNLDLDTPLNGNLSDLLRRVDDEFSMGVGSADTEQYYHQRQPQAAKLEKSVEGLPQSLQTSSYQREDVSISDPELSIRRRAERLERLRDDPFYIPSRNEYSSGAITPFHEILRTSNGEDVDLDSIPIIDLNLEDKSSRVHESVRGSSKRKQRPHEKVFIAAEETLNFEGPVEDQGELEQHAAVGHGRVKDKKSLLEVDSSGIGDFSLEDSSQRAPQDRMDIERRELEEVEMAKALQEVERLRLEMQRASERAQVADGTPLDGTLVKKKKKRRKVPLDMPEDGGSSITIGDADLAPTMVPRVKKKKKKKAEKLAFSENP